MKGRKKVLLIGLAAVMLIALIVFVRYAQPSPEAVAYPDFIKAVEEGKVKTVYLNNDDKIRGEYKSGGSFITDNPRKEDFKEYLLMKNIKVDEMKRQSQFENIASFLLMLAIFGGVLLFVSKGASGQLQGGISKLSSIRTQPEGKTGITLKDIAGNEEAKESVKELIDFIKNPEVFARYGARLPRGIIFYGPPGTGKTLMAKAVAGEADVPFYAVSGSDFVQIYVGVGASRIRDLFKKAREHGKCVIFIDEIDALGKKRDGGIEGGGNDERDQTLNALLAEMSGFHENEGIIVIAATNRLDTLDEALLRPGRFDRHIEIGLPDVKGRYEILKLHSSNKPLANNVSLMELAQQTVYFSGAKLENLMNEAAILAAKRNSGKIEKADIERAFYTVIAGAEKKDRSTIADIDRRITAIHEAGHALITKLIAPENIVSRITIIPSTKGAGGFSMNIPPDRMYFKKVDMENSIRIALAGRAAEEIIFGEENITTGASNDIERATEILLNMVRRFGMKQQTGLLNYDVLYRNGIRQVQNEWIEECKKTMDKLYSEVKEKLLEKKELLEAIATRLLEVETIGENELNELIEQYKKKSENAA